MILVLKKWDSRLNVEDSVADVLLPVCCMRVCDVTWGKNGDEAVDSQGGLESSQWSPSTLLQP